MLLIFLRSPPRFLPHADEKRNELLFSERAREDLGAELGRVTAQLRQRDAIVRQSLRTEKSLLVVIISILLHMKESIFIEPT
jgi:hypothetical protein